MIYETLAITPNYDIAFDDIGKLAWKQGALSVADRAFFDLSSNNNWELDSALGVNWIDKIGTGLLQIRNPEVSIINALERKISSIGGIQSVDEIEFTPSKDRHVNIVITCTVEGGEQIKIRNEVNSI